MKEQVKTIDKVLQAVGIDVSKATIDVAFVYTDGESSERYSNDETGIGLVLVKLQETTGLYKVVMESTGRYHLLAALRLSEAGVDVRVINPLLAKPYYGGQIRKVKTDKADARVLARMALLEPKLPAQFGSDKIAIQFEVLNPQPLMSWKQSGFSTSNSAKNGVACLPGKATSSSHGDVQ